ncbi:hypothetical protein KSS87_023838 [Heliosperma pusillum]|nr:hypothetical protein KSS87_013938 [Heliosperma pusillum]KAH9619374.1 hypothetical protein KSS87_023838 [Heliosperma pusillum]
MVTTQVNQVILGFWVIGLYSFAPNKLMWRCLTNSFYALVTNNTT